MFTVVKLRIAAYFLVIGAAFAAAGAVIHTRANDTVELPVIMYHSVLKDRSHTGKYIVTPESVESDIRYLAEHGYKSVPASALIEYAAGNDSLPEKPYLLTFDDGCYNNLVYILPLLEKYDAYAVISVVGSYSQEFSQTDEANAAYSYLRWSDISQLVQSGRVEIGNHSYNMHSIDGNRIGAKKGKYEDALSYAQAFTDDYTRTENLLRENCGIKPVIYTYPFGAYCNESEQILMENDYVMTLTCSEGINKLEHTAQSLRLLKRFNRHGCLDSYTFFEKCGIK